MKKALLFSIAALAFGLQGISQAYESQITYGKKKQKSINMDYSFSQEAVENAIVQKIEKMGYLAKAEKGLFNKDKGFIVFKDAFISDINEERLDYVIKVERKSRREKDETTLYILMQKNGEDAIPAMDLQGIRNAKQFLANLLPDIEEADLELQIKSQDEVVVKAEKKFKDLQDEKASLENKLKKNAEEIENQQKHIESQRQSLDVLKGKRKGATAPSAGN